MTPATTRAITSFRAITSAITRAITPVITSVLTPFQLVRAQKEQIAKKAKRAIPSKRDMESTLLHHSAPM